MRKFLVNQDLLHPAAFLECLKEIDGYLNQLGSNVRQNVQSMPVNFLADASLTNELFDGEDKYVWLQIGQKLLGLNILSVSKYSLRLPNLRLLVLFLMYNGRLIYHLLSRYVELYQTVKLKQTLSPEEFMYKVQFPSTQQSTNYQFIYQDAASLYCLVRYVARRAEARAPPIEELLLRHPHTALLERLCGAAQKCCAFVGSTLGEFVSQRVFLPACSPDYAADLHVRTLYRTIFGAPLTNSRDAEEVQKRAQFYALLQRCDNIADCVLDAVCHAYASALECESFLEVVNLVAAENDFAYCLAETSLGIDYYYTGSAYRTLFSQFDKPTTDVLYAIGLFLSEKMST